MIEAVLLGTAASAPTIQRGLPAQIVIHKDERFLIDCGEGTQRQILRSGLGFRRLERVLITHGHLDHILGLGGLVSTFARWEAVDHLNIYGGRWALDRVEDLLFRVVLRGARPPVPVELVDVRPGLLFESDSLNVTAFAVRHRGPGCHGYRFQEEARRPFLVEKAEALGVPAGPERRELVNGKRVTLADGRIIEPDDVLGPARPGVSVAITGDVAEIDGLIEPLQDVDLLICEATYLQRDAAMAEQFGHLTAAQAATLAREANARSLVLNHVSQRYRVRDMVTEAREIFPDTIVARDFDRFRVTRDRIDLVNEELHDDETFFKTLVDETADASSST